MRALPRVPPSCVTAAAALPMPPCENTPPPSPPPGRQTSLTGEPKQIITTEKGTLKRHLFDFGVDLCSFTHSQHCFTPLSSVSSSWVSL